MCCTSIHLLVGALLFFAVENEAKTTSNYTENIPVPVSMNNTNDPDNFTTSNFSVTESNMTTVNGSSDNKSDASPTPSPSGHPQNSSFTTNVSQKTASQSSTKSTTQSTTTKKASTTKEPAVAPNHGPTYIIIFIIAVLCISGVVIYCCLKKNGRKYSVDLHPKQEDAQIPLSTVDVEVFDTTSVKDLQTFTVESTEPAKDPEPVKEAEKPEEVKESADVKQENQQNSSSTEATEKPKDKVEGLTIVDLTDGEPSISTKTSMESLDDVLNENNINNKKAEDL